MGWGFWPIFIIPSILIIIPSPRITLLRPHPKLTRRYPHPQTLLPVKTRIAYTPQRIRCLFPDLYWNTAERCLVEYPHHTFSYLFLTWIRRLKLIRRQVLDNAAKQGYFFG